MHSAVLQDLSFALRKFRRNPGFALTVILTLALGIGATTAIFSLVDGILLRPLPFPDADRLVAIDTLEFPPGIAPTNVGAANIVRSSYPNLFDWRKENHTFDSLASYDYQHRLFSHANGERARVLTGGRVSANLFSTLCVAPILGRMFTAEEEKSGHRVVILSYELWVSDFASSPKTIGQTVLISDEPSTIVGVMPRGFHYPVDQPASFWATYAADDEGLTPNTSIREWDRIAVVGRLKRGLSISQALADLNTIQRGLAQQYPEDRDLSGVAIQPLLNEQVGEVRPVLTLLLSAIGLVLLIACANVAGLLLARAASRRPEISVRTALGATRIRILRQLLVEALLLALGGGIVGVLASIALLRAGLRLIPTDIPRLFNVGINFRALAFAIALSGVTALIFGLLPAWRTSHTDPDSALRDGSNQMTSGRRRNRLHHALVIGETALGFTLLIGSGLLIKSLVNLLRLDPGFDADHTVFFDVALTTKLYPDPSKVAFYNKLLPELATIPGVERVGAGHPVAGFGSWWGSWTNFTITGGTDQADNSPAAQAVAVMPGYFETLSIPLFRGRTFSARDNDPKSSPVAIVNRSFVQQYFRNEDPIGRYFTPTFPYTGEPVLAREIIGIVGDTRTGDPSNPYQPQFFLPYAQNPTHQRPLVVMKVAGDPLAYENTVRAVVARFDKDEPVFGYQTFAAGLESQAAEPRFAAILISAFSVVALLLAALGLYAVLSYVVSERMRELGLRVALGASRSDILHLVARRALVLTSFGIGAGALGSFFAQSLISDFLFRVAPLDRSIYALVVTVIFSVSIVAALGPALRAAYVDPMRTLREQ